MFLLFQTRLAWMHATPLTKKTASFCKRDISVEIRIPLYYNKRLVHIYVLNLFCTNTNNLLYFWTPNNKTLFSWEAWWFKFDFNSMLALYFWLPASSISPFVFPLTLFATFRATRCTKRCSWPSSKANSWRAVSKKCAPGSTPLCTLVPAPYTRETRCWREFELASRI